MCRQNQRTEKIYKNVKNNKTASVTVAPPHIRAGLQLTSVSTEPVTWKKSRIRQKWSWSFQPCVSVRGKQHNQYCLTMIMSAVVLPRLKKKSDLWRKPINLQRKQTANMPVRGWASPHLSVTASEKVIVKQKGLQCMCVCVFNSF